MKSCFKITSLLFLFITAISSCHKKHYGEKRHSSSSAKIDSVQTPDIVVVDSTGTNQNRQFYHFEKDSISAKDYYESAFQDLQQMLFKEQKLSFKKGVFVVENAWYENTLNYGRVNSYIQKLASACTQWKKYNKIIYHEDDSTQVATAASIFRIMTDTVWGKDGSIVSLPYSYEFEDSFAKQNWENMFVTKLMVSKKGNCHSLPFLYKILSDELGVKAYFSFVPNHIYIKQKCKKGWYNIELTNGLFPSDAWLMTSGYVSRESIVSGIYMDTIGDVQSISICLNDLAKGYLRKFPNDADLKFVLKCCNLGLTYFPNYAELLLLKAETLKKQYKTQKSAEIYKDMESTYVKLVKLHYREIPNQMYNEWMLSLERDKNIYESKEIKTIFNPQAK